MRIMCYNVHSCVGTDGLCAPARIAEVIAQFAPDVVALQELDHQRARSQHVHQARSIAEELKMHFHFHPALRVADEEYGEAILSRYPLRVVLAEELPGTPPDWCRETRGALWVELDVAGEAWQVINTHFGLGRAERLEQAQALLGGKWVGAAMLQPPLVLCGDFNSQAGGRVQRLLAAHLADVQAKRHRPTFPSRFPLLCLDYIFVGEHVAVDLVDVPRNALTRTASDHLPLIADLRFVPKAAVLADAAPLRAVAG
jgi:endonuclease/exonuclease/phosphatase family metal-dependent hydrolase